MSDPTLSEIMEQVKAGWPTAPRHQEALVTEIERQAEELRLLWIDRDAYVDRVERQAAEIERLREALEKISRVPEYEKGNVYGLVGYMRRTARAALNEG